MDYCIMTGSSMACSHITGIVALMTSVYPTWSPSAIKSAIMTTATVVDINRIPITVDPGIRGNPFDYGSGFINVRQVLDPGLVYDAQPQYYKEFLCSIGYNEMLHHLITGDGSTCNHTLAMPSSLNYPSIMVSHLKNEFVVTRTVTNVRNSTTTYKAAVISPAGINVTVVPIQLTSDGYGQKMNFSVNFKALVTLQHDVFGSL